MSRWYKGFGVKYPRSKCRDSEVGGEFNQHVKKRRKREGRCVRREEGCRLGKKGCGDIVTWDRWQKARGA